MTDNHNYVAMGLSNTKGMGNSSVIECVRVFRIEAFTSWTIDQVAAQRTYVVNSFLFKLHEMCYK